MTLYLVKVTPRCLVQVIETPVLVEQLMFGPASLPELKFRKKLDRLDIDYRGFEAAFEGRNDDPLRDVVGTKDTIDYELCYGNVSFHAVDQVAELAARLLEKHRDTDDPEVKWVLELFETAAREGRAVLVGCN